VSSKRVEIEFQEISINTEDRQQVNRIYFVVENKKCRVADAIKHLDSKIKADIQNILRRIASIPGYKSNKLRWRLKKYNFGEIKPKGHRFFFFKQFGNCIVFFDYQEKKREGSLKSKVYQLIQSKGERYAQAFKEYKDQH